jgi:hypothetical protein
MEGQAFSPSYDVVIWLSLANKPDQRHTGRLRKRDNLLTGEERGKVEEEPNNMTA